MPRIELEHLVRVLQVKNAEINLNSGAKLNSYAQLFLTFFHMTDAPKI